MSINTDLTYNINANNMLVSTLVDPGKVRDGINSLLSMFELTGQIKNLFPRQIMTAPYSGAFTVYSVQELFQAFNEAKFKDCRISAYPYTNGNIEDFIPNIHLLDLDLDSKIVNGESKRKAIEVLKGKVNKIIARLQRVYKIDIFKVIWSGNGYHIIIPFRFSRPFEHLAEFSKYLDLLPNTFSISEEFLIFAKKFLSNNQADRANHPTFRSMYLRVPGTLNTKRRFSMVPDIVRIDHEREFDEYDLLDYPDIYASTDLLHEFMGYLDDKTLEYKIQQSQFSHSMYGNSNSPETIYWIETLWKTPVSDCRKRIIWLILTRYAINKRNMTIATAHLWIREWLKRCDSIRPVSDITDDYIVYYLNLAKDSKYLPLALNTIKDYEWTMSESGTTFYNLIQQRMKR